MVTIIITGMPGSGKDVFVQEAAGMGFNHIRMGDMVRMFARESDIGNDDSSIGGFATAQRERHGPDIWARRTLERMPDGNVIIDGSRSLDEIEHFRRKLGTGLKVIAIDAPEQSRFRRLKQRGREDDPEQLEQFHARDRRELSWGLGKAMENADIKIINDRDLDSFRKKCQGVLSSILEDT